MFFFNLVIRIWGAIIKSIDYISPVIPIIICELLSSFPSF